MFIYMNKKIQMPDRQNLYALSWNTEQGWISCGGENGLLKVLKLDSKHKSSKSGNNPISMNQTLEGHSYPVMLTTWNEEYRKLTTSDKNGLIIVWMKFKGMWFEEMINNRNKSVVRDMAWTSDGKRICIVYEDGAVIVGSVDGNRLWGNELDIELAFVEWSPDKRHLLFGTTSGEVFLYDNNGEFACRCTVYAVDAHSGVNISGLKWYNGNNGYLEPNVPCLAIAFENGRVQISRDEHDDNPVLIDTQMTIKHIQWNTYGSVLAIAGTRFVVDAQSGSQGSSEMIQFYDPFGKHLRTLRVKGNNCTAMAWEGGSLRMAIAVDATIFFANIRPDYEWGYFSNTLVYSFTKPERSENCVAFYDQNTDERIVKYVNSLLCIRAAGENCVFATRAEDSNKYILILCNAIGSPIDSKIMDVEPLFVAMTPFHVVVANHTECYVWQYRTAASKLTSLKKRALGQSKRIQRTRVFHIDDVTANSNGKSDSMMGQPTNDPIVSVTASTNALIIARSSGQLFRYTLPHISLEAAYVVKSRPQKMELNCTSQILSIIDINGYLTMFDMFEKDEKNNTVGKQLDFMRKDAWDMKWSEEDPTMFAAMEKNRMYVYRGTFPEEPVDYNGYLCQFNELAITAVLLNDIMSDPEHVDKDYLINFETKPLRDTKNLLATVPISEAYQFVDDHPHPRLWRILAEAALEELKFAVADKAFVKCQDYQGIQFVKRLKLLNDRYKQRAEVAAYFKRFDEAETIFRNMGCPELAVELRMRLGDWNRVVALIQGQNIEGAANDNDKQLMEAYNNIGDYYADRQKWGKAFRAYSKAKNLERLVNIAYILDDYDALDDLVKQIPDGSEFLKSVGAKFMSVGLCSEAVTCYLKASDAKAAIDCCILLNQWDQAVQLAEEHKFPMIQGLLARYAKVLLEKQEFFQAIELYRKAGRSPDAVKLIMKIANESMRTHKLNPSRTKKLFVLAALEMDRYKSKMLNTHDITSTNTQQTLASLLEHDASSADTKGMTESWHGAEAFHFWQLAQRQLFDGMQNNAMNTALRLTEYEDVLDAKDIYSLIALTSYYNKFFGQCSRAFIRLESLETLTDEERNKYKKLAIRIFVRYQPPTDPDAQHFPCANVKCDAHVASWQSSCHDCGKKFPACVVSGRSILSQSDTHTCKNCKHQMYRLEMGNLSNCPLCHSVLR